MGKRVPPAQQPPQGKVVQRPDLDRLFEEYTSKLEQKVAAQTRQLKDELAASQQEKAELEATLRSIGDGLAALDRDGRITRVNHAFESLTGWPATEAIGRKVYDVMPMEDESGRRLSLDERPYRRVLAPGHRGVYNTSIYYVRRDKSRFPANVTLAPIIAGGGVVGVVIDFVDMTERKQAEAQIAAERQRLQDVFTQAPAIIAVTSGPNHVIELANPMYMNLIGRDRQIIGKPVTEALPELESQGFVKLLDQVYKTGKPYTGREVPNKIDRRGDGNLETVYLNFVYQPYKDASGQVAGIFGHAVDVTEQVLARRKVEDSEARWRFLAESMPQKIFTAMPGGEVDYYNPQWMEFTGLTFEQIRDWGWQQFIHPHDVKENLRVWQHSIATGEPFQFEHRFRRHDGQYRWHLSRALPMRDESGNIIKWFGSNTDIHDQKQIQEALKSSEARFRTVVEQSPISIQIFSPDGRTTQVNSAWEELWGVSSDEAKAILAEYNVLRDPQLKAKGVLPYIKRGFAGETVMIPPVLYDPADLGKPGRPRWIEATIYPITSPDGQIKEVALVHLDVTAQNRSREDLERRVEQRTAELAKEREFLNAMLNNIQDGIVACDDKGRLSLFNRATRAFHGLPEEPLPPSKWAQHYSLYYSDGKTPMRRRDIPLFRAFSGELVRNAEMVIAPKQGLARVLVASGQAIFGPGRKKLGAVVVMHDITEQKRAAEELRRSERRLAEAQQIASMGSWEWDLKSNKLRWSEEMYRIYGVEPDTFDPTYEEVKGFTHSDDVDFVASQVQQALKTKGSFAFDYRIVRPDQATRTLYSQGQIVTDDHGKAVKLVGTAQDITERKQVEQLKSDFVSLVSHQLKTPVAVVRGYIENLLSGVAGDLPPKAREYLEDIRDVSAKNYDLIADLLNFSRLERGVVSVKVEPVSAAEIINLSLRNYRERIDQKGLQLHVKHGDAGALVLADKFKMVEAISNIIDNAIKFTSKGSITVAAAAKGNFMVVEVQDTGKGMDSHMLDKLFRRDQVFSGSPTPDGGSGLGLYIAKAFMNIQAGDVTAESKLGHGSTFRFKIPLAKDKALSMMKE
ncbi:MAG TPA: PAS domain S-box protein [Candidatus Saccharimonadales bacterium]|nr:PAS domain S-box protein [Candidatus Saccharimonadales bacterium]